MTTSKWRLLPDIKASGPAQMALDQALLDCAGDKGFIPTLRFLHFQPPALTIGHFQNLEEIDVEACKRNGIEVARRPTGGKAILHLDDFTYSIVLPASSHPPESTLGAYAILCGGIILALRSLGLETSLDSNEGPSYKKTGPACFAATTGADLRYHSRKICGSAQTRHHGNVLQHGSILLEENSALLFDLLRFEEADRRGKARLDYRQAYVPLHEVAADTSWQELAEAFADGFAKAFAAELYNTDLTTSERLRWNRLMQEAQQLSLIPRSPNA
jgi:lipoyl(octanoyl) transferase